MGAMTLLSHPACSSGFIHDFMDHYTLEWQFLLTCKVSRYCTILLFKCKRQYLLTCKVSRYCLLACTAVGLIIGSNVGSIVYMVGDSPSIARRVNRVPSCPDRLHPLVSRFYSVKFCVLLVIQH